MKLKYKVGDIVKVREDLEEGGDFGRLCVSNEMAEFAGKLVTISSVNDGNDYLIEEDGETYYWIDGMFEDIKDAKNVDIGYYLEYCGHRVIKNVYYGGYAHDHNHVFCTTADNKNQYTLPVDSIEFIIPHED